MKTTALLLLSAALLLPASAPGARGGDRRVLTGTYTSGYQDRPASVRVEFTATGQNEWRVIFHFRHAGRPHSYRGTARSNLTDGALSGRVRNESGNRTFTFRCQMENGRFRGSHYEVARGREHRTGAMTLKG